MVDSFFSLPFFLLILGIYAGGAVGTVFFYGQDRRANRLAHGSAVMASALGCVFAGAGLISQRILTWSVPTSLPSLDIVLRVDRMSSLFILILSLVGVASSLFGFRYMEKYVGHYRLASFGFFYNLFLLSLLLVATAHHAIYFLLVWEIMSLTSFFLVIFENKKLASTRAGFLYLIMMHVGTAFIALAFLGLYRATGQFEFGAIQSQAAAVSQAVASLIFIFAFIGFGTKAGLIPLHVWLPQAHPAAPAHVSALMSGVMIKTSVLMMIKIFFDLLGGSLGQPVWWGMVLMVVGAASALLGVLYALAEQDIKKLLAYSSIENIGIIFIGLGSAFTLRALGLDALAIVGLAAALFHVFNHAIFKSLLFLGAGTVIHETHASNLEAYGGLAQRMPVTSVFFLVGALAISGLPPLNGFISEWLTFQALFSGVQHGGFLSQTIFVLSIAALGLTGGLAAACFVRLYGAIFLARPRTDASAQAHEASGYFLSALGFLAALCLSVGLLASYGIAPLVRAIQETTAFADSASAIESVNGVVSVNEGFATVTATFLFLELAVIVAITGLFVSRLTRRNRVINGRTWDCGEDLSPATEITAAGLARSLIVIFRGILRPTKQVDTEYHDSRIRYLTKSQSVTLSLHNVYDAYLYRPVHAGMTWMAERMKRIQSGNVNAYIFYILVILIGLLLWATRSTV